MGLVGIIVISVVMFCAALGAVASLFNAEEGLGKEFLDGLHAIGHIFIPVAGIMISIPYLSRFIEVLVGPTFSAIGADPAMAATSLIAVDMGGYQLADRLAHSKESCTMAMITGYMAGATIVFSIPVGLKLLDKRDHQCMALGIMSGLLSIPIGVLVSCLLIILLHPQIRGTVSTNAVADYNLTMTLPVVFANLAPLAGFVGLLALGLRLIPAAMIKGFMVFGRVMNALITLVFVSATIEYFTGIFYGKGLCTLLFQNWSFDPLIADFGQIESKSRAGQALENQDVTRALEVAGYIGLMLSGAFPMVYLINKYLSKVTARLGTTLGLEPAGAAGILATLANIIAMFRLVRGMRPRDKVLNIAFAVCAAFLFGDHLAFTANFQPNLILPVVAGKLAGGVSGLCLAHYLAVPTALKLELRELEEGRRSGRKAANTGQGLAVV
jgi:ethanolamine transporter